MEARGLNTGKVLLDQTQNPSAVSFCAAQWPMQMLPQKQGPKLFACPCSRVLRGVLSLATQSWLLVTADFIVLQAWWAGPLLKAVPIAPSCSREFCK